MVQPKTPPLSIRLNEAMLASIDAYAAQSKITRHAAAIELLAMGIALAEEPPAMMNLSKAELDHIIKVTKPGVMVRVRDDDAVKYVPMRMPRAPIGSLAKKPKGK